ncbi:MAG: MFS transporter [Gammaproteobacteria bacterium]|nr:MFS transporter [Gammaproteobacteria bacterium]
MAAAIGSGAGVVHYHSLGAMIVPLEQTMGWSRSEISSGLLIGSITALFFTFLAGMVADRIGARRVALTGVTLYAMAIVGIGFSGPTIVSWYVAWGVLAVVQGMASGVIWSLAIVSRFSRHRGLALAIVLSGSGLCVAVVPPFALLLTETWGWRAAYFGLGAAIIVVAMPFLIAFFRDAHDLARSNADAAAVVHAADARESKTGLSLHEVFAGRLVYQSGISFVLLGIAVSTFLVHLQPMLIDAGITAKTAAFIASVVGPSLIVGRLVTGALLDRMSTPLISGTIALLPPVCCLLMLGFDGSFIVAVLIAILLGLVTGAEGDLLAFVLAKYFGAKNFGALLGIVGGIFGIGFGLAPVLAGMTFDTLGSYTLILKINAIFSLLAATMLYALGNPPEYT